MASRRSIKSIKEGPGSDSIKIQSRDVQKLKPSSFNEKMIEDAKIIDKNFNNLFFLDLDVTKNPNHHDNCEPVREINDANILL